MKAPARRCTWLDFCTGELVERAAPPATDREARCYVPQDADTQAAYSRLREAGATPAGAIQAIVTAALAAWHPPRRCPACYGAPCGCAWGARAA